MNAVLFDRNRLEREIPRRGFVRYNIAINSGEGLADDDELATRRLIRSKNTNILRIAVTLGFFSVMVSGLIICFRNDNRARFAISLRKAKMATTTDILRRFRDTKRTIFFDTFFRRVRASSTSDFTEADFELIVPWSPKSTSESES